MTTVWKLCLSHRTDTVLPRPIMMDPSLPIWAVPIAATLLGLLLGRPLARWQLVRPLPPQSSNMHLDLLSFQRFDLEIKMLSRIFGLPRYIGAPCLAIATRQSTHNLAGRASSEALPAHLSALPCLPQSLQLYRLWNLGRKLPRLAPPWHILMQDVAQATPDRPRRLPSMLPFWVATSTPIIAAIPCIPLKLSIYPL